MYTVQAFLFRIILTFMRNCGQRKSLPVVTVSQTYCIVSRKYHFEHIKTRDAMQCSHLNYALALPIRFRFTIPSLCNFTLQYINQKQWMHFNYLHFHEMPRLPLRTHNFSEAILNRYFTTITTLYPRWK